MDKVWQLQDAKSHFSELVERAVKGETQVVTKRGKKAAVLIAYDDYLGFKKQPKNLLELLRGDGPLYDDLPFERSKEISRDIDLSDLE